MARDYYEVLGVSRGASTAELQRAYRTLARRNHPDVNSDPAAEERFKEVNEAYHVLADPKLRQRYDRFGPEFRSMPEDLDQRYQRAGTGRPGARAGYGWASAGGGRASAGGGAAGDLFGDLFAGADQEAEITLPVEDAYRGGRRTMTLGARTYDVTIPAGVTDGQRIRLAGQGGSAYGGGRPGDLYLAVRIAPHPRYRLHGRDLTVDLPVTPWEAALGATVPLVTPGGGATVTVPPHSSSGRRLRLRGQGLPNPRGTPGDLFAEVKVMAPPRLSDRERELFEELARVSPFDPREGGTS